MKKFLKFMLGVGGCIFYYIVVCVLLGVDVYDPWDKAVKWIKGKEEKTSDDLFDEDEEW